jgi:hypothetical protein
MIDLIRATWQDLVHNPARARIWIRAFAMWLFGILVPVASVGWDVAEHWTLRAWIGHLVFAAVLGTAGLISSHGPRE